MDIKVKSHYIVVKLKSVGLIYTRDKILRIFRVSYHRERLFSIK